jgi:hypothetical protein
MRSIAAKPRKKSGLFLVLKCHYATEFPQTWPRCLDSAGKLGNLRAIAPLRIV